MADVNEMASRLRAVFRTVTRRAEAMCGPDSPTRSEQGVLAWLEDKGPLSQRALSDLHLVRPQTMQQTLDTLEKRRWIRRAPHPTDRRQILFSITASGRAALLKGRRIRQAWLVSEIGRLSPQDRRTLGSAIEILEQFIVNKTTTNHSYEPTHH